MLSFRNSERGGTASCEPSLQRRFTREIGVSGMALLCLIGLTFVGGCGGSKPAATAKGEKVTAASKSSSKSKTTAKNEESSDAGGSKSASTGGGRKSSNGIPYDAFFDEPLGEVANTAAAPMTANVAKTEAAPAEAKPATPKAAASGGAIVWADFISIDVLQNEAKKIRNQLAADMQGPGKYNQKCKDISWDAAVVAGLAGIVIEHSEAASWKANAHYVRDFSTQLSSAAGQPGKEYFDKSKVAYEKLASVFGGTIPGDAGDVAPKKPFFEAADRAGLMKRIEKASEWLRLNINTEAKLKSELETIQHETMLVASLGKIIATEGYTDAEEADYQKFATDLITGGKEAGEAAKDQNYAKFTESINKIGKSCTECHPKYAQ